MIIGLVGEKLAGKDTVANYLVEKYGAEPMARELLARVLRYAGGKEKHCRQHEYQLQ